MRIALYAATLLFALYATPSPSLAKTPFEEAAQLIEAGQIPEARRALVEELRIHPKHVEARYNLAVLLQEIGQQKEAAKLYEENLAIAWHLPSVINLATILQQQGNTAQAKRWLHKATKKLSYEAAPWYLLAAMAEAEGRIHDAAKNYRKAVTTDPLNGFAHLRLAGFQSRRQIGDKGVKEIDRATALLPDCAPCWRESGDILFAAGKLQAALKSYQHSLAIRPDAKTRQQLIHLLNSLGEHMRATRMQQALDIWKKYQHVDSDL